MSERQPGLGRIEVSPTAIASIVNEAVLTCYGVVGTAAKNLPSGIANLLSRDSKRGIEVRIEDGQIFIDVYVIIEYGTRIAAVARSVMNVVKFSVERALGVPVAEVNVHVEGLRISDID
ncbi:MAG: Asp23/Gls24 family envelope stress response protein [Chloroflexota bacterium]|nr:MAG: Asp23/Gls24 family envelope stress response protein [Chloroflexota bacterium]